MDKIITELLKNAIDSIDNLHDYYNSQKKYVKEYVVENIEKKEKNKKENLSILLLLYVISVLCGLLMRLIL